MVDPIVHAQSQKMSWVAKSLDPVYASAWKYIENCMLLRFHTDRMVIWSSQLIETLENLVYL